jgi:PKD repeat protein
MEGQDEMTNILSETDPGNIKRTFAGLSINGCMKMIDSYGLDGSNMADTWTVFGDPTIMVRTAVPQPMTAVYDTMLFVGDTAISVSCNVNGARVTATTGNAIMATNLIADGTTALVFPALNNAFDTVHLVITAYNMLPFEGQLIVRPVPAPVVAGFIGVPAQVVPGNSVAFADTSSGNTISWQWQFPGGTPEVSNEKNPVVTYNTVGTYDVKLIAGNGFGADTVLSTGYITVDFPASTFDKTAMFNCTVLPNPSNGLFNMNVKTSHAEVLEITVFDMIGTKVFVEQVQPETGLFTRAMNLSTLADGIYFLKISGKEGMITKKLVIKR